MLQFVSLRKEYPLKFTFVIFCLSILLATGCFQTEPGRVAEVTADSATRRLSASEHARYANAARHFYDSALAPIGFNGAMLVAKNGEIVFEQYSGTRHLKGTDTIDANTSFHLASVSKTFTAMAILKLWEENKLSLSDSLGKYFPAFPYPGIDIRMLLNHRSGLANYTHYLDHYKWDKKIRATNKDVLQSLYTYRPPLQFATGKHFSYCNTNYALLALIIEQVSGKWYGEYLAETFFRPLKMNDSFVFQWADSARVTPSYEYNTRLYPFDFLDLVYGDKNIYSTPRDLLKWDQALYSGEFFSKATLDSAFAPYSFERPGVRNYGLGWRMQVPASGPKVIYHNGWWHGNNTVFTRLIADTATIIVLGNKRNGAIYRVKPLFRHFPHYGGSQEELEE